VNDLNAIAVVVTFNPEIEALKRLFESLSRQVQKIIVVDNGSSNYSEFSGALATFDVECVALTQSTNLGIAQAQNLGIVKARSFGATHIALFDQDSEPLPQMIEQLHRAIVFKQAQGVRVACVGPNYLDERRYTPPPFIRFEGLKLIRVNCSDSNSIVAVDYLIASGSLVPISTFDTVGLMREDLFIDYVDIEWGLRAKDLGLCSFGVCNAKMRHNLGDEPLLVFGRKYPLHSPLRHYYHFRNAILLYRDGRFPFNWKLVDGWRLLLKFGAYSLFASPRSSHFWMMALGIYHGLIGKAGPLKIPKAKT
jgi:rhamnosyltransferase